MERGVGQAAQRNIPHDLCHGIDTSSEDDPLITVAAENRAAFQ